MPKTRFFLFFFFSYVFRRLQKHPEASRSIQKHPEASRNVEKHLEAKKNRILGLECLQRDRYIANVATSLQAFAVFGASGKRKIALKSGKKTKNPGKKRLFVASSRKTHLDVPKPFYRMLKLILSTKKYKKISKSAQKWPG